MLMKKNTKSAEADLPETKPLGKIPMSLGFADILVTVLFLFIAVLSINLFRLDLQQTITLRNVEPVGYVVIRENIVQRRVIDRVLWDRLATESPVYLGDLIRVAQLSGATLYIEGNTINLSENTIIRIALAPDNETLQVVMNEGSLSLVTTAESRRVSLDVGGRQIQTASADAASLSVTSVEGDIILSVNEGTVQFIEDAQEQAREVSAGGIISIDASGVERAERAAVVIHPASGARYINASRTSFPVNFLWNRVNFEAVELLRLEIATDRNFNNIVHIHRNLDTQVQAAVGNGLWFWRLAYEDAVLGEGRFTVVDGAGLRLQSPAANSVFTYTNELPALNFQWETVDEASFYILEICNTPYFLAPHIQRENHAAFFNDSSLGQGTWYWRVRPVFPAVYVGNTSFSQVSYFRIEQTVVIPEAEVKVAEVSLTEWLVALQETRASVQEVIPIIAVQPEPVPVAPEPAPVVPQAPVLLPAPQRLQPARARSFTMSDLQTQRTINFSWQAVRGANAYILTIYQQTQGGRQQIYRTQPLTRTNYILEDLRILDRGTFIWQVEAVSRSPNNTIQQHGTIAESTFIMDIVLPGVIHAMQAEGTAGLSFPAPQRLQPQRDRRFTMSDLQNQRTINFSWQAVRGANAYIFTLYQQTQEGKREIYSTRPMTRTNYIFEDLGILDRGPFIWQVEAVRINSNGSIEQRGNAAESAFFMDILLPGTVQIRGTGVIE